MKKMLLFAVVIMTICNSWTPRLSSAGKKHLPKTIAPAFFAKYPDARLKGWELRDDQYTVNFTDEKNKWTAVYSIHGNWIRTEKDIPLTKDLPPAVRNGFRNSPYVSWQVDGIKECLSNDARPYYIIQVDNGDLLDSDHYDAFKTSRTLTFTENGEMH